MNNIVKTTIACLVLISLLSFKYLSDQFEFAYPKRNNTTVTINADGFKNFKKEWRGDDYYYMGTSKDDIICSVLYFKLNKGEQAQMVDPTGPSAMIPYIYFSENSNLKAYERDNEK